MIYRFHPAAAGEHLDNVAFYESRQAGLGGDYLAEFEAVLNHICTEPNFYPLDSEPDIHRAGMRRFPFHILYRITQRDILVLAVAHHRRRPAYWMGRIEKR